MSKRSARLWIRQAQRRRELRWQLLERDGTRCCYCGVELTIPVSHSVGSPPTMITIEHDPPRRLLPIERWFDLDVTKLACLGCNQGRRNEGDNINA